MNNVHQLFNEIVANQEDLEDNYRSDSHLRLQSGGGSGNNGGMEARVVKLENDVKVLDGKFDAVMKRLDGIDSDLKSIMKDVARIEGRVSTMPSTWQLLMMIVGIMGFAFALAFAILRFGIPS